MEERCEQAELTNKFLITWTYQYCNDTGPGDRDHLGPWNLEHISLKDLSVSAATKGPWVSGSDIIQQSRISLWKNKNNFCHICFRMNTKQRK